LSDEDLNDVEILKQVSQLQQRKESFIFNEAVKVTDPKTGKQKVKLSRGDEKRKQARIPNNRCALSVLMLKVLQYLITLGVVNYGTSVSSPVVMRSLPGCSPQPWHRDYRKEFLKQYASNMKPVSVLIFTAKSYLNLLGPKGQRCRVEFNRGDVIVFGPDFPHAGASVLPGT